MLSHCRIHLLQHLSCLESMISCLYSKQQNKDGLVCFREAFSTDVFLRISEIQQSNLMVSNKNLHLVLGNRSSNTPTNLPKKLTNTLKSLDLCLQQVNRYKTKKHGLFDYVGSCKVFEPLHFFISVFKVLFS